MTAANYVPSQSLTGYYAGRETNRPSRHWATEKLIHDLAAIGLLTFFEGPGPNPLSLSGASTAKLWLDTEAGVTSSSGSFKRYSGSGSASDEANWIAVTPGAYLLHLGTLSPSTAVVDFATQAAAEAASIESGTLYVRTAGLTTVGDGGNALYAKVGSEPSHEGKFQSIDTAWWELVYDDGINILQFGADRTGTLGASAEIINAFQALEAMGGGKLTIPRGEYLLDATVQPGVMACDVELVFDTGATFIADTGLDEPGLDLRASSSTITDHTLIIRNPAIDMSAGTTVVAEQTSTALATQYWRHCTIENSDIYGGEEPDNTNADSGISTVCNGVTIITGGRIRGFSDSAIYPNGDNTVGTTGDGVSVIVRGVEISRCQNAVTAKRELNNLAVSGCYIYECTAGIVAAEVASPYTGPVRTMDISNNRFKKITANVTRFRGPAKGSFRGNTIEDWGYKYDATGSVGANAYALLLQGTTDIDVSGNSFALVDWMLDNQRAVSLANVTLDSVLYTQGNNRFSDNIYRDIAYGIVDTASTTANTYIDELFDNVTNITAGTFNASSFMSYKIASQPGQTWKRVSNVVYRENLPEMVTSTSSVVLTSENVGTCYRNDGATGLVTYTLPDASLGLEFEFIVSDTDGIRIQTATGDSIVSATSGTSTAGGYAQSTTAYAYIKLRAINTSAWYSVGQTGTWTMA